MYIFLLYLYVIYFMLCYRYITTYSCTLSKVLYLGSRSGQGLDYMHIFLSLHQVHVGRSTYIAWLLHFCAVVCCIYVYVFLKNILNRGDNTSLYLLLLIIHRLQQSDLAIAFQNPPPEYYKYNRDSKMNLNNYIDLCMYPLCNFSNTYKRRQI